MINLECITPVDHICGMRASRSLTRLRAELFPTSSTSWWLKGRSEEHTSELQSHHDLVCRLLLEKKNMQDTPSIRQVAKSIAWIALSQLVPTLILASYSHAPPTIPRNWLSCRHFICLARTLHRVA